MRTSELHKETPIPDILIKRSSVDLCSLNVIS